ncbi:PREDICTED: orcokinin peptides-like [Eufriesea mexicana]|uniref:orcokinin peptides-like n=1 Tax=Eufriesea mexicana TaxID=516756 RepID=UPI00083C4B4B|nr:PREDICTED: orcokinin peptides-like [Eufriesea mexicana]
MADHASFALSILVLSIAATVWVKALPSLQAEPNPLRRDFYGSANPEFFGAYLNDHGLPREKMAQAEQYSSRLRGGNVSRMFKGSIDPESRYLRDEEAGNRDSRNLDHIGGGNLLRRRLAEGLGERLGEREDSRLYDSRRWMASRRNLDQIGGGNLLREAVDRGQRNLDHIGGGNLVRDLDSVLVTNDNPRRNLDQIGGGNLVRSIFETARGTDHRPDETR